jgi:hypothetical protein
MEESGDAVVRWDNGRSRWRRRPVADATVVATNGAAMLVRVALHPDLHIGSRVEIALAQGEGAVVIRHIAPVGDHDVALVGIEFVETDAALAAHLAQRTLDLTDGAATDRWWWQQGS